LPGNRKRARAFERSAPAQRYFFLLALLREDLYGEAVLMSSRTLVLPELRWNRRPGLVGNIRERTTTDFNG